MMLQYLLGLVVGAVIGIIAALIGVGGGFLYVPSLIFIFGLEPRIAIGTSISIILFTTLSGSIAYLRQKRIFFRSAICLIVPSMIFSVLGAGSTVYISDMVLSLIFSLVLLIIGIKMIVPALPIISPLTFGPYYDENRRDLFSTEAHNRLYYLHTSTWGAIAGFMSGLTGIGGGVINVPALVIGGMPIHFAVATSTAVILCTSISAAYAHLRLGNIALPYTAVFSMGAVIGAQIGARIAPAINPEHLKTGVGLILLVTSITILLKNSGLLS
jgi:uncharacterized membrane protein YfcA